MELSLQRQILEAAATLLLGLALGGVYTVLSVLRRRHGRLAGVLLDLAFCVLFAVSLFALGMGPGQGSLRAVFAAETDLAFCAAGEELGLLAALGIAALTMALALRGFRGGAAGAAAGTFLAVSAALNAFGSLTVLPFTGVAYPFLSRGGSAMVSAWCLAAVTERRGTL